MCLNRRETCLCAWGSSEASPGAKQKREPPALPPDPMESGGTTGADRPTGKDGDTIKEAQAGRRYRGTGIRGTGGQNRESYIRPILINWTHS